MAAPPDSDEREDLRSPSSGATRSAAFALLLLVAIFHGPDTKNGFVYDDAWTIVRNPILGDPASLVTLLGSGNAREGIPDAGRPTLLATEIVDFALWALDPPGWHLQSVLWHYGVTLLFFLLALRLTRDLTLSLAAAGVFAVHPLLVEAVAVVNYREDLLAAFFTLSAFGLMARARAASGRGRGLRIAATVAMAIGCLAKENAMMAPLLLVTVDVCAGRDSAREIVRRHWRDYALLAAACMAVFVWRWAVIGGAAVVSHTAVIPAAHENRPRTVLHGAWVLVRGMAQLWLPLGLSPEYDEIPTGSASLVAGALSAAGLAIAAVVAFRRRAQQPWVALGIVGGIVAYLPTSGIIPISNLRADRYLYLPALPLLLGSCSLVLDLVRRSRWLAGRPFLDMPRLWLGMGLAFVALGTVTLSHARTFRDDIALWTAATKKAPTSPRAWSALGEARMRGGSTIAALAAVQESLRLEPDWGHTRQLLGIISMQQGTLERAHAELETALALGVPDRAELLNNLGYCELRLGRFDAAIARFEESARLAPRYDRPLLNAAKAYEKLGQRERSLETLRRLVARIPTSADAWNQLGIALEAAGDRPGALDAYQRAARTGTMAGDPILKRSLARLRGSAP